MRSSGSGFGKEERQPQNKIIAVDDVVQSAGGIESDLTAHDRRVVKGEGNETYNLMNVPASASLEKGI